jgi:uncharacterized protein (TIGR03067 family)
MRTLRFAMLLIVAALLLKSAAAQTSDKEVDKLQGTWMPQKLLYNGKDLSEDARFKFKLIFKGKQATLVGGADTVKDYGKLLFKLDPSTSPRICDMSVGNSDQVIEGIYELKGNELKICARVFGKDRPTEFSSPGGAGIALAVFKKEP